ncbi:MAG: autoinducer binding domain-containing protein [Hyphomonadaceae bacterium]
MSTDRVQLAESLLSFFELSCSAISEAELQQGLMDRLAPYGVTHVSAGITADRNRVVKLGSQHRGFGRYNVPWAEVYFGQRLFLSDPILVHSIRAERANYWDRAIDMKKLRKPEQAVFSMAAACGLKDGFLVPLPLFNGDVMVVSFQGPEIDRHPHVEAALRAFGLYYGTEGQRLASGSRVKAGAFASLTTRQVQVLHLSALGSRQEEIADKLGITINTVEYHLKIVRQRLGVRSTTEAVGLIHAAPRNLFTSHGIP